MFRGVYFNGIKIAFKQGVHVHAVNDLTSSRSMLILPILFLNLVQKSGIEIVNLFLETYSDRSPLDDIVYFTGLM